jgi:hypothetical protein
MSDCAGKAVAEVAMAEAMADRRGGRLRGAPDAGVTPPTVDGLDALSASAIEASSAVAITKLDDAV